MTESKKSVTLRKLQKSKTGYYLNLPKDIAKQLQLTGDEHVRIIKEPDENKLTIEFIGITEI